MKNEPKSKREIVLSIEGEGKLTGDLNRAPAGVRRIISILDALPKGRMLPPRVMASRANLSLASIRVYSGETAMIPYRVRVRSRLKREDGSAVRSRVFFAGKVTVREALKRFPDLYE